MSNDADLYRQAFEVAGEALLIVEGGRIIEENESAREALGEDAPGALRGRALVDFVTAQEGGEGEARAAFEARLTAALEGRRERFEAVFKGCTGGRFRARVSLSPLGARLVVSLGARQAEEGQIKKGYARAMELLPDLTGKADTKGYFVELNASWEKTLGYSLEELLSMPYIDFVHPDDREATLTQAARNEEGELGMSFENRYRHKDGSYRWLSWTSVTLLEESRIFFLARDITHEKEVEARLRESEARLRSIMDSTPAVIMALAPDGKILDINRHGLRVPEQELRGASIFDVVSTERGIDIRERLAHVLSTGEIVSYDARHDLPEGGFVWYHNQMGPLYQDGEITGAIAVVVDVTTQKRLEQDLHASQERLRVYAEELESKNRQLEDEIEERAQQAALMRAMSTPIIRVWKGVLALPVIGLLDAVRAAQMMDALLREILEVKARYAIVDLTGVERVDAETAAHLSNIVGAVGLLGSRCVLSGISPAMAQTMVEHDLASPAFLTFSKLEDALRYALGRSQRS